MKNFIKQFLKFFVTGGIGAVVDFSIFNFLYSVIGWKQFAIVFGLKIVFANLASVFSAIVSNFILNKYWTFSDRTGNVAKQWGSYFTLNFITFILNQFLTAFFAFQILNRMFNDTMALNIAKALAIGLILGINFLGSKFLIFRPTPAQLPEG